MSAFNQQARALREETRNLVEWLFGQIEFYRKNAPSLANDIKKLEDCAAALDTFAAGLAIVPPHPALGITHVHWVDIGADGAPLPPQYEWVLIAVPTSRHATLAYRVGDVWMTSTTLPPVHPIRWARMPDVPATYRLADDAEATA